MGCALTCLAQNDKPPKKKTLVYTRPSKSPTVEEEQTSHLYGLTSSQGSHPPHPLTLPIPPRSIVSPILVSSSPSCTSTPIPCPVVSIVTPDIAVTSAESFLPPTREDNSPTSYTPPNHLTEAELLTFAQIEVAEAMTDEGMADEAEVVDYQDGDGVDHDQDEAMRITEDAEDTAHALFGP